MKRFQDQNLGESPTIAVVANDALGNFVVSTPLLQMLRGKYPTAKISFFGGVRTAELQSASDLIDHSFLLHGASAKQLSDMFRSETGKYDLVVNLENAALAIVAAGLLVEEDGYVVGPVVAPGARASFPYSDDEQGRLQADQEWIRPSVAASYDILDSGWIGEIFCRMSYLDGAIPRYSLTAEPPWDPIPEVLIATLGTGADKLWQKEKWAEVLKNFCRMSKSVGLLGALPAKQKLYWSGNTVEEDLVAAGLVQDLRGKFTLPEVVGAIQNAQLVLTIDNGILHLAASTETPIIGLFREGINRLWAPPVSSLKVILPDPGKSVESISVQTVIGAINDVF